MRLPVVWAQNFRRHLTKYSGTNVDGTESDEYADSGEEATDAQLLSPMSNQSPLSAAERRFMHTVATRTDPASRSGYVYTNRVMAALIYAYTWSINNEQESHIDSEIDRFLNPTRSTSYGYCVQVHGACRTYGSNTYYRRSNGLIAPTLHFV
ncbi:hypothetical protein POJ06DRAFT_241330 [Lipomyces tetrasporus]|uniref:Uncharacterized protein n=1 Tax=Lipomyces tetrasporus TaxID=54092 RepID=A0AAD7QK46_9ASCO|nr:uncharacterized protein POJ06DRAFT_241330 [Lipomyces tetrasporus]KAJ8096680.1 hypothetical protein POJ06DRAFT_241330 [Lipomyces tetrasporus]